MDYGTSVYDPALEALVKEATVLLARTVEWRAFRAIIDPVDACSPEMRQFYWLTILRILRAPGEAVVRQEEWP